MKPMRFEFFNKKDNQEGYTLIEVMITVVIMGLILIMVNAVLIAMIRTSQETDARIKIRQGSEFSLEVIKRNVKSADAMGIEMWNLNEGGERIDCDTGPCDGFTAPLTDSSLEVSFFMEDDDEEIGAIKAEWVDTGNGSTRALNLSSRAEFDVDEFYVEMSTDEQSGTTLVIVTVESDSISKKRGGDPVVDDYAKQISIVTRGLGL